MSKMKRFAAMTAALLISASTMGYLPQDSIIISNVTANAAEVTAESVEINTENFPDKIFRNYVKENFDTDGDSVLSDKEIAAVTKIDVYDMGISDLTGIEYFENLAILECMFNKLTTLDISKNTALIELNCYHNQLTSLDVSDHTELIKLYFDSNNITSIDLSNNTALTELSCSDTKLTSIDISNNTALTGLYCYDGQLTSLDISKNTALETLRCMSNQLTSLDVSNNTALTRLFCYNNQLTSLDISKNTALKTLWCMENQFTSLDLSNNTALEALRAEDNKYEIALTDNTFDLSTLPTGFDVSKASEWTNATVEGNILTIEDVTKAVTYKYDFGNEHSETFILIPQVSKTPVETTTAPKATTTTAPKATTTAAPKTTTTATTTTTAMFTTTTFAPPSYSWHLNVYPYDKADTIYEIGEELDYSTICVHGYGGGENFHADIPYISLDRCGSYLTIDDSEFDNTKPGTYTIYVKWHDAVDSFEVTVIDPDNPTAIPGVEINETNFPDPVFRQYLAKNFDKNTDGRLSDKEIAAVTSLHLYELGISDLTGLQYFKNLQTLDCSENNLSQLDISENKALTHLYCSYNNLTTLDTSNNILLFALDCHKNKLTKLDLNNNPELAALWCSNNQLTSLDVSNNTMLYDLACDNNQLASIDLSNTICKEISDWGLMLSKNKHRIKITDNTFDLSTLPAGFDVSKASDWTNGTVKGNILTIEDITKEVTYTYDCGLGFSDTFALVPQIEETLVETTTAPKTTATTTTTTTTAMFTTTTFAPPSYSCSLSVYPYDEADTIYEIGEELDLSTICVNGHGTMTSFGNTSYMDIPYISLDKCSSVTVDASEFDNTKPGTYTIYVEWYDAVDSFDVTVIDPDNPTAIPGVEINETNFPDPVFRQYLAENSDKNKDGRLSDKEIADVTDLSLGELGISDLTGIQHFENLSSLWCYDNNLTTLDVSNNTELEILACGNNQLTSLDVSHNTLLTDLMCSNNQLASVDLSNTNCLEGWEFGVGLTNNKHRIKITDNTFDLSTLPTNFDVTKASDWTNGTVKGNILTIEDITKEVTYTYDCGLGFSETFTLVPQIAEENTGVEINEANFPDAIFLEYIKNNFDKDGDGVLSAEEIAAVTEINFIDNDTIIRVSDLSGIEYFTSLTSLNCGYSNLTSLDLSKNTALTNLNCTGNKLTSLDLSKNTALTVFSCYNNRLTSLDVSNNTALTNLTCGYNILASLDVSNNTELKELNCDYNQLTSLDVSNNTALTELYCHNNQLTSLDLSKNTALVALFCKDNRLTSLDLSNNTALTELTCTNNKLTSLDLSNNTALTALYCNNNKLTSLNVSNNASLSFLNCYGNQLASLDISNNSALTYLHCSYNKLTSLDLSNNTALIKLYADNEYEINLIDNTFDLSTLPTGFDVSKASDWTNATVEGNILTIEDVTKEVTYKYDCGSGFSGTFTIVSQKTEKPVEIITSVVADSTPTTTTTTTTTVPVTTTTPEDDLPQTGFSNLYNCIPVSAGALVLLGMYAVKKSRKEDEEE